MAEHVTHKLFLRWAWINILAIIFFVLLGMSGFVDGLNGAPLLATYTILAVSVCFSGYAGRLMWRADYALENGYGPKSALVQKILHDANHIFHAIWVCQVLGIVGALLGYREETKHAATLVDPNKAISVVFSALGSGLTATLAGVLCSLLFFIEYRLLEHYLGHEDVIASDEME
jgi:hypothetical protein